MTTIQLDDFGKSVLQRYIESVENFNQQVKQAKNVPSREEFTKEFIESDPLFDEFNKQIANLEEQLANLTERRMEVAAPLVDQAYNEAVKDSGIDPEAIKALKSNVNAAAKYLTSMYGDDILKDTPKIDTLKNTAAATGTGTSRRIRGFDIYIDGNYTWVVNKAGKKTSTFNNAAKILGIDTPDFHQAFFASAGSEDWKSPGFPTMVDFTLLDSDGNDHKIRIVKSNDSDEESDDDAE